MRFMVLVRATKRSETGEMPSAEMLSAMAKYNEELIKAGVLLDGAGLKPSSQGARVKFGRSKPTVVDGPFAEAKELVAGYWLFQCKDLAECVEWVKRCPNPMPDDEGVIEIRPFYEASDFENLPADVKLHPDGRVVVERR